MTVKAYNLDDNVIEWAKSMADKNDRSASYIVNRGLKSLMGDKPKSKRVVSKKTLPSNFDEQFDRLWAIKNVGAKKTAKQYLEREAKGDSAEDLESFVSMMIEDITKKLKNPAAGFEEQHLSSYISKECYES